MPASPNRLQTTRRSFIASAAGFLALALGVKAQTRTPVPTVGALFETRIPNDLSVAFRQGLEELGYTDGQEFRVDYRSANGSTQQLRSLASELVRRNPKVILAAGGEAARAALQATKT